MIYEPSFYLYVISRVHLSYPVYPKLPGVEKLVRRKAVPRRETTRGNLLLFLLLAWVRVKPNLHIHHEQGTGCKLLCIQFPVKSSINKARWELEGPTSALRIEFSYMSVPVLVKGKVSPVLN
jgi:hypothetical protein